MIRMIVVLLTGLIVAVHTTYTETNAGSVFAFSLAKNLLVCTFMARWLSSFIGAMANIVLSKDSDLDEKKQDVKKEKRQIAADSRSDDVFPTCGTPSSTSEPVRQVEAAVQPLGKQQPEAIPAKAEALVDRLRRGDLPAVWRLRPQKQLSSRVLAIRT